MTTQVKLASKAGGELEGALAEPAGAGKVGALVVLQEWHGLNAQMRGKCDRFAAEGYLTLVPDLYHGKVATNDEQAGKLMGELDWGKAVAEIGDAVAYLRAHPRSNGKVGVLGFCMGGALALAASRYVEGLACVVPFYGVPSTPLDEFAKVKAPIQAHFAKKDDWAKPEKAEQIQAKVKSGGGHMDLFLYDAGHAFMRDDDPSHYDAEAAKLAWPRALEFLKKHLG
ncbi:MAG TPA: dienelactone hydrolase family protein [Polyangiaceae bacterium]|jgi:carboxymethylenebutenolidase